MTRVQGGFSLRMFHRTFGLMMIQANIEAPCTLLDFPSQERFIAEIRDNEYDVIGIGAIIPNIGKVKRMCELIRQYRPKATIVVVGHIAGKGDIRGIIDADVIVKGDGIRWFRRFVLYTPNPGTPLYEEHLRKGTLLPEAVFPLSDAHGQYRFNYRHKSIPGGHEENFLLNAFRKDFEINGPSLARLIGVLLAGWQRYKDHPHKRIRDRFAREVFPLRSTYAGAVWAMKKWYRDNERLAGKMEELLKEIYATFGWMTRMAAPFTGLFALGSLKREEKRIAERWTYEPVCTYEKNTAALALEKHKAARVKYPPRELSWVSGSPSPAPACPAGSHNDGKNRRARRIVKYCER
ncbi:MAG: hypothetical protein COX51_01815 [Syntrophobacteraceae bacterium CG23_combo_of_CG06-09_8_20_14_all_50_8]|nr:MAG: hypothetical protein COX51_01815 [Syntrophobacteraceae bacterium CG23_combo_of_CG06-09_8_20_14_all_50_8]